MPDQLHAPSHTRPQLEREIAGALRATINAHGPITREWTGSAAKRVISVLKARGVFKEQACHGFQWIGNTSAHCDRCGLPYWEHSHDERYRRDAGPFDDRPFELIPITPEMAEERCRRKWAPDGQTP